MEADPGHDRWPDYFQTLTEEVLAGLRGEGRTADDDPRFSDLAPPIREALSELPETDRRVEPALAFVDYRPANLVFAPEGSDPVVAAVLDLGAGPAVDGLLDLALTEDALVDVPFGGTDRARELRTRLRSAYADERGRRPPGEDPRYPTYRTYARARHLTAFDYWQQFAREDDPDAVATRWRSFVEDRT